MKQLFLTAIVLGILAITGTATAQGTSPCYPSLQGVEQEKTTVAPGETLRAAMVTSVQGRLTVSPNVLVDGWDAGACVGDTAKCGRWRTHWVYETPGTYNETLTWTDGGSKCEVQYEITVEAPEVTPPPPPAADPNDVPWTEEEKAKALSSKGHKVRIAAGVKGAPNMPQYTQYAFAGEVQVKGQPAETKHFVIGGALGVGYTGQPIWPELYPQIMDTPMYMLVGEFMAGGVITAGEDTFGWDVLELTLAGALGAGLSWHGNEDIGEESNGRDRGISGETSPTVYLSPQVNACLYFSEPVGLCGQAELQVNLIPMQEYAGTEEIPVTNAETPDPSIGVIPWFGLFLQVRP